MSNQEQVKILIVGGPCTGKSTLQAALHDALAKQEDDVASVYEYARSYLKDTGGYEDAFERFIVYLGSRHVEGQADAARLVIFDDAPFINVPYGRLYRPTEHDLLHKWDAGMKLIEALEEGNARDFIIYFLPGGAFEAHDDAERFNAEDQAKVSEHIKGYLREQGAAYHMVEASSVEGRVREILDDLAAHSII